MDIVVVVAASFAAGFLGAHLLEPLWHRFVAHGARPDPTRTNHLEHHRLAALKVPVEAELLQHGPRGLVVLAAATGALALVVGPPVGAALGVGLAAGFVAVNYEHARMHARAPRGRWEQWMWRFHWHHHAVDAKTNYGLTHPLVDFALGTAVVPDEVALPQRIVPQWLRDAGGAVAGIRARD